jgi:hypothetical protein
MGISWLCCQNSRCKNSQIIVGPAGTDAGRFPVGTSSQRSKRRSHKMLEQTETGGAIDPVSLKEDILIGFKS